MSAPSTDRTAELHAQLAEGVASLTDSDAWARMLKVSSRFHHYSFGNLKLIGLQCPDATRVAGYKTWQSLGRQVRKSEVGIRIFAPITRKVENDNDEVDRIAVFFKSVSVFDVSQTDGDELPEPCHLLAGDAPSAVWAKLAEQVASAGFSLDRGPCGPANGCTDYSGRTVTVRPDVDPAQATKTLAHELAHVLLHEPADALSREQREVEAESVAFIVCKSLGVDSEDYSFGYVASWGTDTDLISKTAGRVIATARTILGSSEGLSYSDERAEAEERGRSVA
jgi:DNA primase